MNKMDCFSLMRTNLFFGVIIHRIELSSHSKQFRKARLALDSEPSMELVYSLEKVIFVDADQIIRTDMGELYGMDLKGRPLAYIPFCDNNKDMDGYCFLFATSGTLSWMIKDGFSHSRFWFTACAALAQERYKSMQLSRSSRCLQTTVKRGAS
ncbi:hypothetical protein KIW84_024335 [Lathyrus oleraceus]|nr:hypothetical protein KIW84_024335 [Pisum sativum]